MREPILTLLLWGVALGTSGVAQVPPALRPPRFAVGPERLVAGAISHSLTFSPDGRLLASGGDQGDVVVFDLRAGEILRRVPASYHRIGGLRFSPDGDRLAALGHDLTVWEVATGQELLREPSGSPGALDWSRDGTRIAWVGSDRVVHILELASGSITRQSPDCKTIQVTALAFSPSGSRLALSAINGALHILAAHDGALLRSHQLTDTPVALTWPAGPQPMWVASTGSNRIFGRSQVLPRRCRTLLASEDGERVVVSSSDTDCVLTRDGQRSEWTGRSTAIALQADGSHIARATDRGIEIQGLAPGLPRFLDPAHHAAPRAAAFSGDGRHVAVDTFDAGRRLFRLRGLDLEEVDAGSLPSRGTLLTPGDRPEIAVHLDSEQLDAENRFVGQLQYWLPTADSAVLSQSIDLPRGFEDPSPVGRPRLLANGRILSLGALHVDLEAEPLRAVGSRSHPSLHLAISPDGATLVGIDPSPSCIGPGYGKLMFFDPDGQRSAKLHIERLPLGLAFTADGRQVFAPTTDDLQVYDVATRELVATHGTSWQDVHRLPDGTMLGVESAALVLWDVAAAVEVARVDFERRILDIALSADGRRVLVLHRDRLRMVEVTR